MLNNLWRSIFIGLILVPLSSLGADATDIGTWKKPSFSIQHWQLENGAEVYFVPARELPMVDIELLFDAGSARDDEQHGIALFTGSMLDEGTQSFTKDQIVERFEDVGANFSSDTGRDFSSMSFRSLTDPKLLTPALETLTEVVNKPNFPKDSYARVQRQILQAIKEQQQIPSAIASKTFYATAYGKYPYGHDPLGTAESISNLTPSDLENFYKKYYVGQNAVVAIVGDLTREQAEQISFQVAGKLPAGKKPKKRAAPLYDPNQLQVHIEYPSTQTYVRIGEFGINRDDPRFYALTVGNYILGGSGLSSRLFKKVREDKGYTYHINSYFSPMQNTGPFVISFLARKDSAKSAIELSKQVLNQFLQQGISDEELTTAKRYIIGSFPAKLKSNSAIASNIAAIGFYQLPLNYLHTYQDKISKLTKQDVNDAFTKLIDTDQLITVTVGPNVNSEEIAELNEHTMVAVRF